MSLAKPSKGFLQSFQDKWSVEGFADSTRNHIGRSLDRTNVSKWVDVLLNTGLAYQSYQVLDGAKNGPMTALFGPLALRLATSFGGTPPVSQIAGLAMLAYLGLISIPGEKLPGSGPIHDQAQSIENRLPFPLNYVFAYGYQAGNATGDELKAINKEFSDIQAEIQKRTGNWFSSLGVGF